MSLINDALKRAKQAQKSNPTAPAPGPQLRPAEPSPRRNPGNSNLFVPAAILVIIVLVVFVVWQSSQKSPPQPTAQAPAPANNLPAAPKVTAPPVAAAVSQPAPPVIARTEPAVSPPSVAATTAPATADAASVPAAPVKPASPKLQAIFFDPRRSSAMVSGKSVLVGGRVGEFRVAAIEPGSITLTSASATNVLTLESAE